MFDNYIRAGGPVSGNLYAACSSSYDGSYGTYNNERDDIVLVDGLACTWQSGQARLH